MVAEGVEQDSQLQLAQQYGVDIVVMEATRDMLGDGFVTRELDLIQVVGKDEPVRIYELVGQVGSVESSTLAKCKTFKEGLAAYRQQEWDRAIAAFTACQSDRPDVPAQLYCQRIQQLQDNPPPADWDGVWHLTKK